jgi:hypothetical protein
MSRWAVRDDEGEVFIVESLPNGTVSLHIPSPGPLVVTRDRAEQIRLFIGAAIGSVRSEPPS